MLSWSKATSVGTTSLSSRRHFRISALEGTYAPIADVLRADALDPSELSSSVLEVRNFIGAAERGLEMIKTLPVSLRVVREVHGVLLHGIRIFSEAVRLQSESALARADKLSVLRSELAAAHAAKVRGVAVRVVDDLIARPVVTPLVEIGILAEGTGRAYGRLFSALRVLGLLTG